MTDKLWVQESQVHITKDKTGQEVMYSLGTNEPYETFTDNLGRLYKACIQDAGRCTGKMYIDKDGKSQQVGWIFLKRNPEGPGLIERWVEVWLKPPQRRVSWELGVHPTFSRK